MNMNAKWTKANNLLHPKVWENASASFFVVIILLAIAAIEVYSFVKFPMIPTGKEDGGQLTANLSSTEQRALKDVMNSGDKLERNIQDVAHAMKQELLQKIKEKMAKYERKVMIELEELENNITAKQDQIKKRIRNLEQQN